jgi:phage shock protein A
MTHVTALPSIRCEVKPDRLPGGVEGRLAHVRRKLPRLWDRAASALDAGQEQLAGLALRRRRVLLRELDSLTQLVASKAPAGRVESRIEAADRLLEASLNEASRQGQPLPREPVVLELDPAVQSDLRRLREELRNQPGAGPASRDKKGGR